MELCLSGNALKTFGRSIICLARIGNEIVLQASPSLGEVPVTLLEITGNEGAVQVNGKVYSKDSSIHLNEGDEVVFNLSVKPRRMFLLHQRSYISSVTNLQNMFQLSRHCVREFYCQYLQGTSKEPDSVKETSKPERTSVYY